MSYMLSNFKVTKGQIVSECPFFNTEKIWQVSALAA